jgi:O-antigen/teichoic acid export membrane protein
MKKIKKILIDSLKHDLISGSLYVLIGTTVSSFLLFVANIYFARNLTYSDYGTFASLISLIVLLTIPAGSLSAIIVRYAAQFFAQNKYEQAGAFYVKVLKYILLFTLILNIVVVILSPLIMSFLKINEMGLVILVGLSIGVFYITTLNLAFVQSLLRFRLLGSLYLISGIGRLIFGILLLVWGFKVYGALAAVVISSLAGFVISLFVLKRVIIIARGKVSVHRSDVVSYGIPTAIAIFSLSSFITTDVLLAKHFFDPQDAGFYGGLSLIGKVIFYFTGPIPVAMFPLIVKRHTNKENYNNLFYISLLLVLIPSIFMTAFYFIFSEFTVKLFLGGGKYLLVAPYLGLFGIFLTIYSVNNVFVNFFLSIKKTNVFVIVLLSAILQIILVSIFHENFAKIIYVSIFTSIILLGRFFYM